MQTGAVWWSDRLFAALGYASRVRILADVARFYERIHPGDRARVTREVSEACHSGRLSWTSAFKFRNADGVYLNTISACLIYRDSAGATRQLLGVMQIV